MASNCTPETEMDTFLKQIRLAKYREHILDLGAEELEDLQDIPDDELVKMGMKPVEIGRFKRKVNEEIRKESSMNQKPVVQSSDLPFSPTTVDQEKLKKIISQQRIRCNLRISYQLIMTELKPEINHLGVHLTAKRCIILIWLT
ncbi:hypothetical protein LOD99_410 [Oopsacas minuta]|uniref:SAM domain-containing protein n=1 Tax=Oopsacas minuta TaxID=111878 RepID=A0AAV7K8P1_9METZ|nr:hypothetical protein LOD99_410 [Oopsacas minuta]